MEARDDQYISAVNKKDKDEDKSVVSDMSFEEEQDVLQRIKEGVNDWIAYFKINIENFKDDKYFVYVNNYNAKQLGELNLHGKPPLQANKIYDAINKIVGEQRQNTAELEVRSLNGQAPDDLVKLNQDFIRYICFNSKSKNAYQTAFFNQVSGGYGALLVRNDYDKPKDIVQSIFIDPIVDCENTIFDSYAKEPTRSDGNHCGYFIQMNKREFERLHPDVPYPTSFPMPSMLQYFTWGNKDRITIMRWYEKEWFNFKIHKLSNGQIVTDDEWKEMQAQYASISIASNDMNFNMQSMFIPEIVETFNKTDCKIVFYKAIFNKIIEKKYIPGNRLPMVFIPGNSVCINGEDLTISFVRYAKDMQMFHNYMMVEIAHVIQTSRRERFLGTKENVAGVEEIWQDVSNVQGMLVANPDPKTGLPVPIPQAEIPASFLNFFQQTELSIQNILGFYDANRGSDSQAKSGIAYKEQQRTGNLSVAIFYDNLNRGIEEVGRIVMSMKPEIYDTERSIPITSQNGKTTSETVNYEGANGKINNDMTVGDFDIVIDAGPSAEVQKAKSLEIFVQLSALNPQVFPLVADYIGENLSLDSISGIVKRFKTLVPPDVLAMEEGKPPPPQQPNPQMMMAQQQMQVKERDQQIQMSKLQLEFQKMQNEIQKLQQEVEVTMIKAKAEVQKAAIEHNSTMVETTGKIIDSHNNIKRELIR